jgi:hypothetical protein
MTSLLHSVDQHESCEELRVQGRGYILSLWCKATAKSYDKLVETRCREEVDRCVSAREPAGTSPREKRRSRMTGKQVLELQLKLLPTSREGQGTGSGWSQLFLPSRTIRAIVHPDLKSSEEWVQKTKNRTQTQLPAGDPQPH